MATPHTPRGRASQDAHSFHEGHPRTETALTPVRLAEAETAAAAHAAPVAFVVQYDEVGLDGPVTRFLGVFSSEASAREAVRELDRARSLVVRASITSWTLDAPRPRTSVEIDLQA